MRKDPTEFRKRFATWKNGEQVYKDGLPAYRDGKQVLNNYTNAEFNDDGTFTDDTTRMFDDFYVTPSGVKTKYGSYTDKNWDRYKQQEQFFKTHDQQTGKLRYEPGLEIKSPEFDLLTLGAGARTNAATQTFQKNRKIANAISKGIKENSVLKSYNQVEANKDIGNVYDYLDFLDNIYPNSKLNATFYHGGPKGITEFKSAKELGHTNKGINSATKDYGIYLSDDKSLAQYYAETHKKSNRHLYTVRVNVQNPMRYETDNWYLDKMSGTGNFRFRPGEITQKWYDRLNLKNYDGIYHTKSKNAFDNGELVMFDGNNIHIMGTPEEYQMFRAWKQSPQYSFKPLQEKIPITPQQYDKTFKNYVDAATPAILLGGGITTPIGLIGYQIYKNNKKRQNRLIRDKSHNK